MNSKLDKSPIVCDKDNKRVLKRAKDFIKFMESSEVQTKLFDLILIWAILKRDFFSEMSPKDFARLFKTQKSFTKTPHVIIEEIEQNGGGILGKSKYYMCMAFTSISCLLTVLFIFYGIATFIENNFGKQNEFGAFVCPSSNLFSVDSTALALKTSSKNVVQSIVQASIQFFNLLTGKKLETKAIEQEPLFTSAEIKQHLVAETCHFFRGGFMAMAIGMDIFVDLIGFGIKAFTDLSSNNLNMTKSMIIKEQLLINKKIGDKLLRFKSHASDMMTIALYRNFFKIVFGITNVFIGFLFNREVRINFASLYNNTFYTYLQVSRYVVPIGNDDFYKRALVKAWNDTQFPIEFKRLLENPERISLTLYDNPQDSFYTIPEDWNSQSVKGRRAPRFLSNRIQMESNENSNTNSSGEQVTSRPARRATTRVATIAPESPISSPPQGRILRSATRSPTTTPVVATPSTRRRTTRFATKEPETLISPTQGRVLRSASRSRR